MKRAALFLSILTLTGVTAAKPAHAISIGDAALTVGISTATGAVLGASTLPFYGQPGDHTNNIFYGAAVGAVAGVIISAIAGVSDSSADDVSLNQRRQAEYELASNLRFRPDALPRTEQSKRETMVWSPFAKIYF